MTRSWWLVLSLAAASCGPEAVPDGGADADADADADGDVDTDGDADSGEDAEADADDGGGMPEWERGVVDPDASVEGLRGFYLIGNALTPGQDRLEATVQAPSGTTAVDAWIDEAPLGALEASGEAFALDADLTSLGPGEHDLVLAAHGADRAFAALPFVRTHPLYVLVTTDWDDSDNMALTFTHQEELHEAHPGMRLTHFVGPYTFTDPEVTEERRGEIVEWLVGMRDTYDDELGLHIHPYCTFVEAAGVACVTDSSFAYEDGDETGYTIFLGAYDEEQAVTLFETAAQLFEEHGLGTPTTFRAGGWTMELHTLRAMGRAGFVADTSAMNWARMEEWQDVAGASLYEWNAAQWSSIDETSQPYYPNETDILSSAPPQLDVLEVPDNGIMADYVTASEMEEMFDANWAGGALEAPRTYVIGFHPPNFLDRFHDRVDGALTYVDGFLASDGTGPVVYAVLNEMPLVWPREP